MMRRLLCFLSVPEVIGAMACSLIVLQDTVGALEAALRHDWWVVVLKVLGALVFGVNMVRLLAAAWRAA